MTIAMSITYFISPHGFGHAARASAVMDAVLRREPRIRFDIVTGVPAWFFRNLPLDRVRYHQLPTDIGLIQRTPFEEDVPATIRALENHLPFSSELLTRAEDIVRSSQATLVLADIAPLGIVVAKRCQVESVLIENFTWDWIYQGYQSAYPDLNPFIQHYQSLFASASYHIQCTPLTVPSAHASLVTKPIARPFIRSREETRAHVGCPPETKLVLLSMGGTPAEFPFRDALQNRPDCLFIVPSGQTPLHRDGSVLQISSDALYHPDLMQAADLVVGKLGYSTVAEAYYAGTPFLYLCRDQFRESPSLERFVQETIPSRKLTHEEYTSGSWISSMAPLLGSSRSGHTNAGTGADEVASFLLQRLAV